MSAHTLLLIGPPGAGKTTIAAHLAQTTDIAIIATGHQLRAEIEAQSPLGRQLEPLLEQGYLAPDAIMTELMRAWLKAIPPERDCLIDGYPRSVNQALTLTKLLTESGRRIDAVIVLDLSESAILHRLGGRRICRIAGQPDRTLHVSETEAVARCLAQGGVLIQRDDDRPAVIRARLELYQREIEPILQFYADQGVIHHIDAEQPVAAIVSNIQAVLASLR